MKTLPVIPRASALRDVEDTLAHYLEEGAAQAALGFIAALEQGYAHVSHNPSTGSPRYAHALNLPGLRCWPLRRYPQMIFYIERVDHVDVWRVLHGRRDIPGWLQAPAEL